MKFEWHKAVQRTAFCCSVDAHVLGLIAIKQIGPLPLHFDSLRGGADETFIGQYNFKYTY